MENSDYTSPPRRVVLGHLTQNGGSPISPMANLKLLTKVATDNFTEEAPEKNTIETIMTNSRSMRSLGFICKKFLAIHNLEVTHGTNEEISLCHLALQLNVEKRRIYDIINVVSSIEMAVKIGKDRYNWFGNQYLPLALSQLKRYSLENNFDTRLRNLITECPFLLLKKSCPKSDVNEFQPFKLQCTSYEENRIGVLCRKFIMLFLINNQECPLSLNLISKLVLTEDIQDKTGMRRLYDIANVLEALGLIKKCEDKRYRRPSFIYCGPKIDDLNYVDKSSSEICHIKVKPETSTPIRSEPKIIRLVSPMEPPAKKRLIFPAEEKQDEIITIVEGTSFIKAPESSFTWNQDKLITKTETDQTPVKSILVNKPISVVKQIKIQNIQHGQIYRALVGNDNSVRFIKL